MLLWGQTMRAMYMERDSEQRVINTGFSPHAGWAVRDVEQRNRAALRAHEQFFLNHEHQDKIQAVLRIVKGFFTVRKDVFVNHRVGQGKPFTVVKVSSPAWPACSAARADREYRKPLQELGVEIVFSRATNSYLYRIY